MLDSKSLRNLPEFSGHAEVIPLEDAQSGLEAYIALYTTRPSFPSLGATRWWAYSSSEEAVSDALRLSRTMAHKAVMAETPYGGAKGVIRANTSDPERRQAQLRAYGRGIAALRGKFVTGTDVGVSDADLDLFLSETNHIIGKGVPSAYYTALGVFLTIQMFLKRRFKTPSVDGRRFLVQGLGKTGEDLVRFLIDAGASVSGIDIDPTRHERIQKLFPSFRILEKPEDVYRAEADVFCPCGTGGSLTESTVSALRVSLVVGTANNQQADPAVDTLLAERGIWYAPDFLVNAGGFLSVVDQYERGSADETRIIREVGKIPERISRFLDRSLATGTGLGTLAVQEAEVRIRS